MNVIYSNYITFDLGIYGWIVDILWNILNILYNYAHKENEYIHKIMYIYTQKIWKKF